MAGGTHNVLVHATCIAAEGRGALLIGPPGAGKSDLALRTIAGIYRIGGRQVTAELVADDQVGVMLRERRLFGRAPETIAGRIEARGLGIIETSYVPEIELRLAVALVGPHLIERMPQAGVYEILGQRLPQIRLAPFEASAPVKLVFALLNLEQIADGG